MNIVVGVSDIQVSSESDTSIITYALGSCIGIVIYDSAVQVGGIAHFMLPDAGIDKAKAEAQPYMFANTCIPLLFKAAYKLGAKKQRMKVVVAGGAQIMDQSGFFNIGNRNYMAARKILWKNNVITAHEDVGGNTNRTVSLVLKTGLIKLKVARKGVLEL